MSNTEQTGTIAGKISANPNPLFFGQGHVVISWETNDPAGAEVRVSTSPDDEKVVSQGGKSGLVKIPWITNSTVYEFRLYAASRPDTRIDSVRFVGLSIPRRWLYARSQKKRYAEMSIW